MAKQYKTPGVYVVEKNSFGSSIVANATAIPAFIGFTEFALNSQGEPLNRVKGADIVREPVLVRSMLEYQNAFGGADETGTIYVTEKVDKDKNIVYSAVNKTADGSKDYKPGLMQPSVSSFFSNGGGSCYIISIGDYADYSKTETAGLITSQMPFIEQAIEMAETTTLILPTDLTRFKDLNYYTWGTQLTNFSEKEKKYFTVLDVIQKDPIDPAYDPKDITNYRTNVTPEFPSYAGAYFPYLKSLIAYSYKSNLSNVYLNGSTLLTGGDGVNIFSIATTAVVATNQLNATFKSKTNLPAVAIVAGTGPEPSTTIAIGSASGVDTMTITFATDATAASINAVWAEEKGKFPNWTLDFVGTTPTASTDNIIKQLGTWKNALPNVFPFIVSVNSVTVTTEAKTSLSAKTAVGGTKTVVTVDDTTGVVTITVPADESPKGALDLYDPQNQAVQLALNPLYTLPSIAADLEVELDIIYTTNATIEDVKTFLSTNYINMPPSPFMAGIYSRLDNATGVWTPPANVSPTGVSGPVVPLTNKQQEDLNVDATAGKSINAIRSFTGKGTLVWGARTNDGNSMDWRYVNVRRLFISMETDISKALEAYVFKPNVHNTWVEVKTNIESYLFGLFGQGAFAGTVPETSYQVLIGVGETMTDEDVLNGYMRVSIMVAPVRPAEFIVLTFSQMIGQ